MLPACRECLPCWRLSAFKLIVVLNFVLNFVTTDLDHVLVPSLCVDGIYFFTEMNFVLPH